MMYLPEGNFKLSNFINALMLKFHPYAPLSPAD